MTIAQFTQRPAPRPRRFTRTEYYRMAADGFFENQHVELIDGEVIEMAPQNEPHVGAISRLIRILTPMLPPDYELRCQAPLSIGDSEPEPDIAIIALPKADEGAPHTAALVIEVADSSLAIDRKKANLYASARIPEYWIVNLIDRRIECFRDPVSDAVSSFGAKYASVLSFTIGELARSNALAFLNLPVLSIFDV